MIFQKQTCRKGKDKQMKCPYRNLGQKHQMKIRSKAQNFGRVWLVRALAREYDFYDANNKQIASDATLLVKLGIYINPKV